MTPLEGLALGVGVLLAIYLALVGCLVAAGRRSDARAVATLVPDCAVLFHRLVRDPRVSRRRKVVLALVAGYLVMPFDLVPDFIPVAGQLDDAVLVVLALRVVLRGAGPELLREHWPGPEASLKALERLAFGRGR